MVTSQVQYKGSLRTEALHVRSNAQILTDAPIDNHGQGMNFSPTDLTATALASCMLTVMGIKAEKHNINFYNLSADVTKVMTSGPRRISEIYITLHIPDLGWNKETRKLMEYTALNCPVALSLHPETRQQVSFDYAE